MTSQKGFTYTELLISLALMSATLLTLSAVWLSSYRETTEANQFKAAHQILKNIAMELVAQDGNWNEKDLQEWKKISAGALENSTLNLNPHEITLTWPAHQKVLTEKLAF